MSANQKGGQLRESPRRDMLLSKPHIYSMRLGGKLFWTYTPQSPRGYPHKSSLAAHSFCRRLMGLLKP